MNNSKIVLENSFEEEISQHDVWAKSRETELLRTIEAIQFLTKTNEWSSLKSLVFDGLVENLQRQILVEAKQVNPDANKLNRLAGELKWAERFSDFKKWEQTLRVELANIRKKLYGQTT